MRPTSVIFVIFAVDWSVSVVVSYGEERLGISLTFSQAAIKAVYPFFCALFTSAPLLIRYFIIGTCPIVLAAISGEAPYLFPL